MKLIKTLYILLILPFVTIATPEQVDLPALSNKISKVMRQYHYNPDELNSAAYRAMEVKINELAHSTKDKQTFINGFNKIWRDAPFSHVRLDHTRMPAEQMADYLDSMDVGGTGAKLTWHGQTAILTVNTMMGADTIEQIYHAYQEIIEKQATGLVIDLRNNNGGAFAVNPLVSHLIQQPLDAGIFISQPWNSKYQRLPNQQEIAEQTPWTGWSIKRFWQDAQQNAITRIQFQPSALYFDKPVFVLTSKVTASAAELATDALSLVDHVTIVGETTAGEMLSQKMYDLGDNMQLSLPIADYYAVHSGRIEQQGVMPDINMPADKAMDYALEQLSKRQQM